MWTELLRMQLPLIIHMWDLGICRNWAPTGVQKCNQRMPQSFQRKSSECSCALAHTFIGMLSSCKRYTGSWNISRFYKLLVLYICRSSSNLSVLKLLMLTRIYHWTYKRSIKIHIFGRYSVWIYYVLHCVSLCCIMFLLYYTKIYYKHSITFPIHAL